MIPSVHLFLKPKSPGAPADPPGCPEMCPFFFPPSPSSPSWEVPSFSVAAQCRVATTLVLFVFAAVSNSAVLISVFWGRGYRLGAHLRPVIASLAAADLMMSFIVMPLDAVWNITVQWYAGDIMCKLMCFLKLFAMHSAAFILVVVSLDRYRGDPPSTGLSGCWNEEQTHAGSRRGV
ncbi:hypothetical protein fugu_018030 [Takifugu bimaculatus]|uniref:G-protein coupled receptors family 1 profile domain-containing protein n=1 Tax=Takifugu bimaculatus TaxID=433685 RepID=A0A4Z2BLR0_9TELE|nr:hypothetical protein fugu_018030 [Takifugu bimaculatus]